MTQLKLSYIICASCCAISAWAQSPSISNVLNAGIGDRSFAPLSVVYVYGSFPKGLPKDFTITVGGVAGYVNVVNSPGYITAVFPPNVPLGAQPVMVSYQGNASNQYMVNLQQYAPEFETVTVVPVTDQGPHFPLASYFPFAHSDLTPVTNAAPAAPGEKLISLLSGVGPTSPPTKPGGISTFEPLAQQPSVLVDELPAAVTKAGSSGTNVEVDFVLPMNTPIGYDQVTLTINGISSNIVTIPVTNKPLITAVLNAASFRTSGTIAPGSIVSLFGMGFGPTDKFATFPATNVNGTTVTFGNTAAPVFALATVEGQVNAMAPNELPTSGTVDVTIKDPSGTSNSFTVNMAPAVPGIFFFTDPNVPTRRNAAALFANSAWIAMPTSMATAMGILTDCTQFPAAVTCAQPAHVGDVLQIFVTGLGRATAAGNPNGAILPTGTVAPASGSPLYQTVTSPIVTVAGIPTPVLFSGIAPGFAGLYQINIKVPDGVQASDDVPIQISMPGSVTDTATISVQ